ncbi:MAG TPA: NAD(P)/FAD-dependent oxidoreductase [Bacteroidales bacterium]|nr:NAD(P)/FAD-dependent oxidoreductase [Bacteroidales bacterium]
MNNVNVTVIGAGVIGLAIAQKITETRKNVFVIEKHASFGQETSSRNSEVIHAGIYYPRGSLKAKLCVEGKELLYDYCERYEIPFRKCGKLIVATSEEEVNVLEGVRATALKNGVKDLITLNRGEIEKIEPAIYAVSALYSPSTGIIDSHSLMKQYETNTINNGGHVVYRSEVKSISRTNNGYKIDLSDSDGKEYSFTSGTVINAAGLTSDKVAEMLSINDDKLKIIFCKGEYFRINPPKNRLVSRLIYPVPHPRLEHIGVHVTVDMAGGVKLGPDVKYLEFNIQDYKLTPSKQEAFFQSVKKYLPFLEIDDISPEMAGIRSKLQKPGEQVRDYYIREESDRGFPGFINLIGMESPALTSSLAIANYVNNLIKDHV